MLMIAMILAVSLVTSRPIAPVDPVFRFYGEVHNQKALDIIPEIFAADHVAYSSIGAVSAIGPEGELRHMRKSLTFYDAGRSRWHQTWIDSVGEPPYLEGGHEGESMVMTGTTRDGEDPI